MASLTRARTRAGEGKENGIRISDQGAGDPIQGTEGETLCERADGAGGGDRVGGWRRGSVGVVGSGRTPLGEAECRGGQHGPEVAYAKQGADITGQFPGRAGNQPLVEGLRMVVPSMLAWAFPSLGQALTTAPHNGGKVVWRNGKMQVVVNCCHLSRTGVDYSHTLRHWLSQNRNKSIRRRGMITTGTRQQKNN